MDFETRSATSDDRNELYKLYASVMKAHITKIWGWDEAWQQNEFEDRFFPDPIQVATISDRIIAYIHPEMHNGNQHVHMLCVAPEYQRNGIGGALLKGFIRDCSANQQDVTLGVFKINPDARRFYERLGFLVFEEDSTHYRMRRKA